MLVRIHLILVQLICCLFSLNSYAVEYTRAQFDEHVLNAAQRSQCPVDVSPLVKEIVTADNEAIARIRVVAKLRRDMRGQSHVLQCLNAVVTASERLREKNSDSPQLQKFSEQVQENIRGVMRVITSYMEPLQPCEDDCDVAALGPRG